MKKKFLILLSVITLLSCSNDSELNCAAVSCLAGNYEVKLTDLTSGENILTENSVFQIINSENEFIESAIINGLILVSPTSNDVVSGNHTLIIGEKEIQYSYEIIPVGGIKKLLLILRLKGVFLL